MKEQIKNLLAEISEDTCFLSYHVHDHPKLLQVIAMGDAAVPHLIQHLQDYKRIRAESGEPLEFSPWYAIIALSRITGANPIKPQNSGRLMNIIDDWLTWNPEDENDEDAGTL